MQKENEKHPQSVYVWDPIVRVGHWLLVAAFVTAYLTEGEVMPLHSWAGYVVAVVVLIRIVWGFVGSQHAKFKDFIYTPKAVFRYLMSLIQGKKQRFIGHNPAGGAMVIALLLSLLGTTYSGMALYAIEENAGPLSSLYAHDQPPVKWNIVSEANASGGHEEHEHEHENEEEAEEFWEEIHEFFANFTLLLVLVHIGGVIASSRVGKENLVKAMITGRKEKID